MSQWTVRNISGSTGATEAVGHLWKTISDPKCERDPRKQGENIHQLVHKDRQKTINDIADIVSLPYGSAQAILTSGFCTTTRQTVTDLFTRVSFSLITVTLSAPALHTKFSICGLPYFLYDENASQSSPF